MSGDRSWEISLSANRNELRLRSGKGLNAKRNEQSLPRLRGLKRWHWMIVNKLELAEIRQRADRREKRAKAELRKSARRTHP